mmetsp:Transcript_139532/g.255935  ORF Transcript_139532/g.255935 Transcript_139532/m.255935 type:complete len:351 (+) Transcript_139532:1-1053(+)
MKFTLPACILLWPLSLVARIDGRATRSSQFLGVPQAPAQNHTDRNAVFGMSCNFNASVLSPFLVSLRATGFQGAIVMGVDPDLNHATLDFLQRYNVTMHSEPCAEQKEQKKEFPNGHFHGNLNQLRWRHYQRWLSDYNYTNVWFLDTRDVIFQSDPFRSMPRNPQRVFLFADQKRLNMEWSGKHMKSCLGTKGLTWGSFQGADWPELCGGLMFGDAVSVASFVTKMVKVVDAVQAKKQFGNDDEGSITDDEMAARCTTSDQYLLNYVGFHFPQAKRTLFDVFQGPVANVDNCRDLSRYNLTIEPDRPLSKDGTPFALVHKWDHCQQTWHLGSKGPWNGKLWGTNSYAAPR